MKLKSIEINGFKSFADKTKIEFQDGITGIVGPNGSGKSNIIEAVRWVMGETSAKSLRGGKMPDVIFAGTETRKPLARAAVTIILDNSDHFLKTEFNQVMVTRRLFKNGESQYQINQQDCRLKDVLNLFIDTGLGRESFSIISQGRVEEIFNSKPEDRRAIIEEAAGVLEYKQNKQKAEKELDKTTEYLARLNDLITELNQQRIPLEQQASLAQDYLTQKQRFDELEATRLIKLIDKKLAEQAKLTRLIDNLTKQNDDNQKILKQLEQKKETTQTDLTGIVAKKNETQSQVVELTRLDEQLIGKKNLAEERAKQRQSRINALQGKRVELDEQLASLKLQKSKCTTELEQIQSNLATQKQQLTKANQKISSNHKNELTTEISDLRAEYVDTLQALTTIQNERQFNQKLSGQNSHQLDRLNLELTTINTQLSDNQKLLSEKETAVTENTLVVKKLTESRDETQKQGKAIQKKYIESRSEWFESAKVVQQAQARLESLKTVNSEHARFYQGPKAALKLKDIYPGIIGSVAEVLEVESQLTVAIETVLGGQLQNIITDTDQTAKEVITHLRNHQLGRATFLPLNVIRPKTLQHEQLRIISNFEGSVGVAADLVKSSINNDAFIRFLLGNTVVVNTIENAVKLAALLAHRVRIVTLQGDVINAGGTMSGGKSHSTQTGLLQQKNELSHLEQDVSKMQAALLKKEQAVEDLQLKITQLRNEYESQNEKLTGQKELLTTTVNELALQKDRNMQLINRQSAVQFEINQLQVDNVSDDGVKLDKNESKLKQRIDELKQLTVVKNEELANLEATHDKRQAQIVDLKLSITKLTEQNNQQQSELNRITKELSEKESDQKSCAGELQQLLNNSDTQIVVNVSDVKEQLKTAQNKLLVTKDNENALQIKIEQLNHQITEATQKYQNNSTNLSNTKAELTIVTNVINTAYDKISEDLNLTVEQARTKVIEIDETTLTRELKLLRRGIEELGTVNLGAIEEFKRISERYDFLHGQQTDLINSKNQLNQTINEIDVEAGNRFKNTFDEIAKSFGMVFKQMFGGGQAKLELTSPDDLLNTGIEIKAQPPGKKLQRLSLLSGGEKSLTAITLLFAILEVKPVPFCILDEVEAAFDDANVTRFAKYLKNFRQQTQFIVITHRKGTMEEVDVLYGVTMQESGVSKMVSVSLNEVKQEE